MPESQNITLFKISVFTTYKKHQELFEIYSRGFFSLLKRFFRTFFEVLFLAQNEKIIYKRFSVVFSSRTGLFLSDFKTHYSCHEKKRRGTKSCF